MKLCVSWQWVILAAIAVFLADAQYYDDGDAPFLTCSPEKVAYEWERQNFYELLDLSWPADETLDTKDIRKAYRKQAQAWHPDKRKPDDTMTIEEINSRFARISQAYETLSDPSKKQAYDRFLDQCERRNQNQNSQDEHYRDDGYYSQQQYHHRYNPYQQYQQQQQYNDYNTQYQQYSKMYQNMQQSPSNIRTKREMLVDPMTGAPIMRETMFEEYKDLNYYRVLVQDFLVQTMDAWGNTYYHPIYPSPMVVEEGQLYQPPTNTLKPGEFLRAGGTLVSTNGKYRARIQNCQLWIETNQLSEDDVTVLWKSDNFVPYYMGLDAECFLALEGNTIAIAEGSPEFYNGEILWRSTVREDDDDYMSFGFNPTRDYLARMDNDGRLTVYMVDGVPPMMFSEMEDSSELTCIFATGLLGCNPVARKGSHIIRAAKLALRRSLRKIVEKKGEGKDWSDRNEYYDYEDVDDDAFDRILRTLNRARKKTCAALVDKTLKLVHLWKKKWESSRWRHGNERRQQ